MVTYTAAQFGGRYVLIARTNMAGRNLEARDTLTVRVPNLELLPDNANYVKIGGTERHHGPPGYQEDNNHWGASDVIDSLIQIATRWHQEFPNEVVLHINDISLEYGGLFDVNGQWNTNGGHSSHRIGRDVDIRTEFPDQRAGVPIRDPRNSQRIEDIVGNDMFELISRTHGSTAHIHGQLGTNLEHYHLDF